MTDDLLYNPSCHHSRVAFAALPMAVRNVSWFRGGLTVCWLRADKELMKAEMRLFGKL